MKPKSLAASLIRNAIPFKRRLIEMIDQPEKLKEQPRSRLVLFGSRCVVIRRNSIE